MPTQECIGVDIRAVSAEFTLSGYSGLTQDEQQSVWHLVLDEGISQEWKILSSEREHRFLNNLLAPFYARQCLKAFESGRWELRFTELGRGKEFILYEQGEGKLIPALISAAGVSKCSSAHPFSEPLTLTQEQTNELRARFDAAWQNDPRLKKNDRLREQLEFIASPHPAEWVYMKACQIFVPDSDVQENYLDDPPGFTDTAIWNELYPFQKDGVKGVIDKILKYNGCILADSVGLGKTYEALAVIKYFARRGDKVLVLAPKRLRDNWALFTANDDRNPFAGDPFHYDLLNHTDVGRSSGKSGDIDLSHFRWEHFDLIVIDESHNFRNKGSRYQKLLEEIIQKGAKTKVLLLTATPVNNRVTDLRNQINLIAHGNDEHLKSHGIESITETARQAQKKFSDWAKTPETDRVKTSLLNVLGQDYIHLLDLLSIARSRKHIETHYSTEDNRFPTRLAPINCYPEAGDDGFLPVVAISHTLRKLHMAVYRPLHYVLLQRKVHYQTKYNQQLGTNHEFSQEDREKSLSALMTVNLLKRMESSVEAYSITLNKQINATEGLINRLRNNAPPQRLEVVDGMDDDDLDDDEDWIGSAKIQIAPQDIDIPRWLDDLQDDLTHLHELQRHIDVIKRSQDSKLQQIKSLIRQKVEHPINPGNRKVIIFTAFADTAEYLYNKLSPWLQENYELFSAMVSGAKRNRSTLPDIRLDQDSLLSAFSPRSKKFNLTTTGNRQIDILIATDCVSEGQNLQDCDFLINADIHWNPVRIIQRFGRIDRIGSTNKVIQMVNMWPVAELNDYINLEQRVKDKMELLSESATGNDDLLKPDRTKQDIEFRSQQLLKLKDEVINLEDVAADASITKLNFQQPRSDLQNFRLGSHKLRPEQWPSYLGAVSSASAIVPAGAFFLLKSYASLENHKAYPYAPYYLIYVTDDGTVNPQFRNVRDMLELLQLATKGRHTVVQAETEAYYKRTAKGANMAHYTKLLAAAVRTLMGEEKETIARSLLTPGKSMIGRGRTARGVEDVEVITWLAVLP